MNVLFYHEYILCIFYGMDVISSKLKVLIADFICKQNNDKKIKILGSLHNSGILKLLHVYYHL